MKMIFWNAMDFDQFGSLRGSIYILNKGWKFLKKLWRCVGGGNKVICEGLTLETTAL